MSRLKLPRLDRFKFETKLDRIKFETKLDRFKFGTKLDHFWSRRSLVDSSVQISPRPGFKTQSSGCDAVN